MGTTREKVENFKRDELSQMLNQCTGAQQAFFNRLYPKGVPEKKLMNAIDLCERTIAKNRKEAK